MQPVKCETISVFAGLENAAVDNTKKASMESSQTFSCLLKFWTGDTVTSV